MGTLSLVPKPSPQSNTDSTVEETEVVLNHRIITFVLGSLAYRVAFSYAAHNLLGHLFQFVVFSVMLIIASQVNKFRLEFENPDKEIL